jgi:hypothetical protein
MLLPIENAQLSLARYWWSIAGLNLMAMGAFLLPLFQNLLPISIIFSAIGMSAFIGLVIGIYFTFRSRFGSTCGLWGAIYGFVIMELLFSGGCAAMALRIAGRPDLRWLAFYVNALCMLLTLLGSMYLEARHLGIWTNNVEQWKKRLAKYLDYSLHQVSPRLTNDFPNVKKGQVVKSPFWIIAVGSANIPLLFEIYGGGRVNAIFFAAPVITGVLAYLNLKTIGPAITRLILLRKIEKSLGRRFINADLEQIQQLRRGFFMARWLMKDFVQVHIKRVSID